MLASYEKGTKMRESNKYFVQTVRYANANVPDGCMLSLLQNIKSFYLFHDARLCECLALEGL
jgi:hypothetical protein